MVAIASTEATVTKAAAISATRKSTGRKPSRPAEPRTKAAAGESAKCVTATTDKSVSSTSPAMTAAPVSSRGHHP
jgi:hypothetical protein